MMPFEHRNPMNLKRLPQVRHPDPRLAACMPLTLREWTSQSMQRRSIADQLRKKPAFGLGSLSVKAHDGACKAMVRKWLTHLAASMSEI